MSAGRNVSACRRRACRRILECEQRRRRYAKTPIRQYADTPIRLIRRYVSPLADTPLRRYADTIPLRVVELIDHPQHSVSDFANLARCQEREVQELHEQ
jgi:hypothetical protein